jgi:hypothetical protein
MQVSYWFVNARKRLWKPYIKDKEDEDVDVDTVQVWPRAHCSTSCSFLYISAFLPRSVVTKLCSLMETPTSAETYPPTSHHSPSVYTTTWRPYSAQSALTERAARCRATPTPKCSPRSTQVSHPRLSIRRFVPAPLLLIPFALPHTRSFAAISAPKTAQTMQPAAPVGQSQRITVFKSKVGRPPKKKPKLGQLNPHFIESVMTQPLPRFDEPPASLPLTDSPASATNVVAPITAAPESMARPLSDLNSYVQLAQMQSIEMQHRMSTIIALAKMQQPAVYRPSPLAMLDSALLHGLNYYQLLDTSLQMPLMLAPAVNAGVMGRVSLPSLGSLSLQQSAQLERYQEVMTALAATQDPGSAYLQQLRQIEQAQQQLINHLTSSDKQSPCIGNKL